MSITTQAESDRVNAALDGMNRGPEARAQIYERAKKFLRQVLERNQLVLESRNMDHNAEEKKKLLQAFGELDAILSIFPHDIREKFGGYATPAKLENSGKPLATFFLDRARMLDELLERSLRLENRAAANERQRINNSPSATNMGKAVVAHQVQVKVPHVPTNMRNLLCAIAISGCLLALFDMPDEYYKVLRFIVVAASIAVIWDVQKGTGSEQKKTILSVAFGLLAVIFNPLLPLEMNRPLWAVFYIAAAIAFTWFSVSTNGHYRE